MRIGKEFSTGYDVQNGTLQGSIVSPVLFSIMINEVFGDIDYSMGVSLFADDGVIWKRGRNLQFTMAKMQQELQKVESWALAWGFRFSVSKTKWIIFTRKRIHCQLSLKLYGSDIDKVDCFKYLGIWFDERLTWKTHIGKMTEKYKKVLNILRCLQGNDWGADRTALRALYVGLIRSVLDYGCLVYGSAAKTLLNDLDRVQYQALRLCCGAVKTTPVAALQVEMGEQPLELRRRQIALTYWANLKGHSDSHIAQSVLKPCQEQEKGPGQWRSFGWTIGKEVNEMGFSCTDLSPAVALSVLPPWLYDQIIDFYLLRKGRGVTKSQVQDHIVGRYSGYVKIFTDASKLLDNRVGVAFVLPDISYMASARITDGLAVYTGELVAILMALTWVEDAPLGRYLVCSDSSSALVSIGNMSSDSRQDIVFEIFHLLYRIKHRGIEVVFLWVPAHVGVDGNEQADKFAKSAARRSYVGLTIKYSKSEVKSLIKVKLKEKWQAQWDGDGKGRYYYSMQKTVGQCRRSFRSRRDEDIISRVRFGHTGLNSTLKKMGKHDTGTCDFCGQEESFEHVVLECNKYKRERERLQFELQENSVHLRVWDIFQRDAGDVVYRAVFGFLRLTGVYPRL